MTSVVFHTDFIRAAEGIKFGQSNIRLGLEMAFDHCGKSSGIKCSAL